MSLLDELISSYFTYALVVVAVLHVALASGPIAKWRRNKSIEEITAINELPYLGKPRLSGKRIDGTVVVAGGSIGGLLTARICSTHFSRVIVVEPEAWLSTKAGISHDVPESKGDGKKPNPRARVMQYNAIHNYHVYTLYALRELFPNFDAEARKIDPDAIASSDIKLYVGGRHLKAPHGFYKGDFPMHFSVNRHTYETLLRKLVKRDCDNIEYVTGTVVGINTITSSTRDRVESAIIRSKDGVETIEPTLLVVDCTGPASAALKWVSTPAKPLQVPRDTYDPKMFYTTCEFKVDPAAMAKVPIPGGYANSRVILVYTPDPRIARNTLYIFRREHNTVQIACGGWDMHERPRSIDDIRTFISQIKGAEPFPSFVFPFLDALEENNCGASATYFDTRCPPCHSIKYHEVADMLPSNLIALGDSVMRVNPVRGQGCTKAMIGAATLSGALQRCEPIFDQSSGRDILPHDFGMTFWKRHNKRIASLWVQTKADDYNWATTVPVEGETLKKGAFLRWYGRNFLNVAYHNERIAAVLHNSSMFIAPGTDAISPDIAIRVVWAGFKEFLGITKS
ncbi:hypothetical protein SISNIDRAFT_549413 [Sistotremastrum niveocremeum HHB9708]|uniref:FAD/NAD(P)-binding domain-containing protein n=1 Tax=Sistotremastrum niveocremeum HHB9708 TaxID=1314777 RepID=A0A164VKC2_9AGAM|nr:hypothetical protein SISNIDRAFT_549413 [Sistotremastrum niveocremeum HHB9708]